MHLAPGAIIAGRFRLEQALSHGGMSSVWVARHLHLGHPVAMKFMAPRLASSPAYRARFEREARAAANLLSPHIVQVQDYGIDDGVPWLVMELLQGEDLEAVLQRSGRISLCDAARILVQAGKALRRAHEAGIVHRDLKPGNLFLARVEDYEIVKVLDFGIAKESGARITGPETQTGELLGSPYYMSPEQVRGDKELDHRSDLWSLGVILFRAITGAQPFHGEQLGTVMAKILVDPCPSATAIAPDLPASIDSFFARAFARDPAQRFQSVQEMVDALSRIAGASGAVDGPISEGFTPITRAPTVDSAAASSASQGTLTHAGMTGSGTPRAPRSRRPWAFVAGGAVLLVAAAAGVTIARLGSSPPNELAVASAEIASVAASATAPVVEAPAVSASAPAPAPEAPAMSASAPAPAPEAPAPSASVDAADTSMAAPPQPPATPRAPAGRRRGSGRTDKWGVPL